ncbi:MAG: HAMP domain-containing histidine kinase, partial [Coriobacteriaceae bacterium]|nr:HAMP domain-containing histidine kinase [Coriobacteriaceae bacterium]
MKRPRALGIFGKVFLYTTLILVIVVSVAALFFTRQISDAIAISQQQHLSNVFAPLQQELEGKTGREAIEAATAFHEKNAFFEFCVQTLDGQVVYKTPNYEPGMTGMHGPNVFRSAPVTQEGTLAMGQLGFESAFHMMLPTTDGLMILISASPSGIGAYNAVMQKTVLALVILLVAGALCAFLFARSIARPVKALAEDTAKMASLELVSAPVARTDEIGAMANDVYSMYERLKETIRELEGEIRKQREMEEGQRYFFAAASHELKTPVAATSALLEGMLEEVIPPKDYPQNLRTCLRLAHEQAGLIAEILELVRLNDRRLMTHPTPARLADLVESVLATHLTLAQAHAQRIEVAVADDAVVTLDQTLFKRALSNVVANALQNTPDGGRVRIAAAAGRGRGEGTGTQEAGRQGAPVPGQEAHGQDTHTQEGESPAQEAAGAAQDRVRLSVLNEGA